MLSTSLRTTFKFEFDKADFTIEGTTITIDPDWRY